MQNKLSSAKVQEAGVQLQNILIKLIKGANSTECIQTKVSMIYLKLNNQSKAEERSDNYSRSKAKK